MNVTYLIIGIIGLIFGAIIWAKYEKYKRLGIFGYLIFFSGFGLLITSFFTKPS